MTGGLTEKILNALSEQVLNNIWAGKETLILEMLKAVVSGSQLRDGLFESWGERRLNIAYDAIDHKALANMEYNLFNFSCVRERANVFAMNELLFNKEHNGIKTFEDFKNAAAPYQENVNKNWLQTEYNFTVATGQNASRYNQFISEMDDVTEYVLYQTVGDDAVRPAHQLLDGLIFSMKDPEALRLWPPNAYGCRCEYLQYFLAGGDKVTSGTKGIDLINWNDKEEKMFGINRGDIGQVFTQNQMYMKANKIGTDIDRVKYSDYDLKKLSKLTGFDKLTLDKSITGKNVNELFTAEPGTTKMAFKDYNDRQLTLDKKIFDKYTGKAYQAEQRHRQFAKVTDILKEPDEVYFNSFDGKTFQTNYIKHYDGQSLLVNTSMGKNNVEVNTWYEMKTDEPRKGLLIKGNNIK
jgi:SPP1 gp7 family putative phage head morphogenesis protein